MATISGGRGWTGVVGAIAGSMSMTLISVVALIESENACAAARAVSAAPRRVGGAGDAQDAGAAHGRRVDIAGQRAAEDLLARGSG